MKNGSHIYLALLHISDSKAGALQRVSVSQLVVTGGTTVGDLLPANPTGPGPDLKNWDCDTDANLYLRNTGSHQTKQMICTFYKVDFVMTV